MVKSCCVWGCSARYRRGAGLGFFRIPSSGDQRAGWLRQIKRVKCSESAETQSQRSTPQSWLPGRWDLVCGRHFVTGRPSQHQSHPDFLPTLYLRPGDMTSSPKSTSHKHVGKLNRYDRHMKRSSLFDGENPCCDSSTPIPTKQEDDSSSQQCTADVEDVTDLQAENNQLRECNQKLSEEVLALKKERDRLKDKLAKVSFSHDNLSDKKMRFYTGLPCLAVFMWIFGLIGTCVTERQVVSKQNQLLITLMKLRLGLQNTDIANRFGVSVSTVSQVLSQCIPLLAERLKFLIQWPTKEILTRNMPESFRKRFSNCSVIIDCTEFFIERPYNLKTRAKTWSNYKHHHTLKGLIGITPYGAVSFVSKLWGGRISDKEITERSGFYDNIKHGDQVMADRGFTIVNELARKGATLVMPPFLKGRKQLPGAVVQRARQLSSLRIHVERAMERIKNFKILKNTLPSTLVGHASDILTVCGALTTLSPRLIK